MVDLSLRVLTGEPAEMHELQRLIEAAPTYIHRVTGLPAGPADAQSLYSALPPGKGYDDKFVLAFDRAGEMVACADLIRGYPAASIATLGLLLVPDHLQRQGIGGQAYALIEAMVRSWPGCTTVRIGVVLSNDEVLPFWSTLGFVPTGESKPYRYAAIESQTILLHKPMRADAPGAPGLGCTPAPGKGPR